MAKKSNVPPQSSMSVRKEFQRRVKRRNALRSPCNHLASRSDYHSQPISGFRSGHKSRPRKPSLDLTRYVLDSEDQNDDGSLCGRCQRINFEEIFDVPGREINLHGIPILELGSLVPEQRLADCSLCALFASAAFGPLGEQEWTSPVPNDGSDLWHLRLYSALQVLRLKHTKPRQRLCKSRVLSVVHSSAEYAHFGGKTWLSKNYDAFLNREVIVPVHFKVGTRNWKLHQGQQRMRLNDVASGRVFNYQGRLLRANKIRYSILRRWINDCDDYHFSCSDSFSGFSKRDLPPAKWLIDCEEREDYRYEILLSTAGLEYFNLSYVLGGHHDKKNMDVRKVGSRRFLPEKLPTSISDAMTVVRELGYRYLWVDRYCIDQHSSSPEKMEQIGRMDEIFHAAVATIIATGSNADSGLPGVSNRARYPQPVAKLHNMTLISCSPNQSPILESTPWHRRGWTLQEYLLSSRCLIFTDTQIYFTCRQSRQAESIMKSRGVDEICKSESSDSFIGLDLSQISSRRIGRFAAKSWPLLDIQLQEYTGRDLTYASDALNGFRGILKRSNHKTYWGIPIFRRSKTDRNTEHWPTRPIDFGFANGVLWVPSR